jgi:nitrite reductase (NADH) small subunit
MTDSASPSSLSDPATRRRRPSWSRACRLDSIVPDTGVCALIAGRQVAVFRVGESVYALDNRDPFTGAAVLSRGLVTARNGALAVASPLHKQRFDLETGVCLDDAATRVETYRVRVRAGVIEIEHP